LHIGMNFRFVGENICDVVAAVQPRAWGYCFVTKHVIVNSADPAYLTGIFVHSYMV
jgi:hypothetical protein